MEIVKEINGLILSLFKSVYWWSKSGFICFVYKEKYLIREKTGIDDLGGLIFKVFNMTRRIYFSGIRVVTFLGHHWGSYISLPVMTPSSYIKLCLQQWVWNEIERASKHADLLSESDVNKRADIESKEDGSECVDGRHSWGAELVNNPVRSSMFQQLTNFCVSILLIT